MDRFAYSIVISVGMFAAIFILWELGRRIALYRQRKDLEAEKTGIGAVEGAVFGLMGLMLAFSFSGAMTRWDEKRALVVEEANDIGTAWLRLDLLPQPAHAELQELFRRYLDSRLAAYAAMPDRVAVNAELARGAVLQRDIWSRAVAACTGPDGERARILLLPALNAMIDITTTRAVAMDTHPPRIVNIVVVGLVLVSSMLAGGAMADDRSRGWMHMICFALVMAFSVYLVMDLEYPREGLFRIDAVDQVLVDLRASMN